MNSSVTDACIANQDPAVQPVLKQVRDTIREALDDCEEVISWQMPTWRRKTNIIHFAAMKNHLGLYPGPEAVEHFAEELKKRGLSYSKGTIRFPYSHVDTGFIREIALFARNSLS
jgi:uncharacterized protein YdhG (YjbR/CyaY superfamily)